MDTQFSPSRNCCDHDAEPESCIIATSLTSDLSDFDTFPTPSGWELESHTLTANTTAILVHKQEHPVATAASGRVTTRFRLSALNQTISLIFDYVDASNFRRAELSLSATALWLRIRDASGSVLPGGEYSSLSAGGAFELQDELTLCVEFSSQGIVATVPSLRLPELFFGAKIMTAYEPLGGTRAGISSTGGSVDHPVTAIAWTFLRSSLDIASCGECQRPVPDCVCCPTQPPSSVLVAFPTQFQNYTGDHWLDVSGCDVGGTYILQPFVPCEWHHDSGRVGFYKRPRRSPTCSPLPVPAVGEATEYSFAFSVSAKLEHDYASAKCRWSVLLLYYMDVFFEGYGTGEEPPEAYDCNQVQSARYLSTWLDMDDDDLCGISEATIVCNKDMSHPTTGNTTPPCVGDWPSTLNITPQNG